MAEEGYATGNPEISASASKVKRNGILIIILGVIWGIFSFIGLAGARNTGELIANVLYLIGSIGYIVVGVLGVLAANKREAESAKRFHMGLIIIFIFEVLICLAYIIVMIIIWLDFKNAADSQIGGETGEALATGFALLLILIFAIFIGIAMMITCCCCWCCINTAKRYVNLLGDQSVWARAQPAQTA